jgi:hypothetical protein
MAAKNAWPEKAVKSSMSKQLKVQLGWAIVAPMAGSLISASINGRACWMAYSLVTAVQSTSSWHLSHARGPPVWVSGRLVSNNMTLFKSTIAILHNIKLPYQGLQDSQTQCSRIIEDLGCGIAWHASGLLSSLHMRLAIFFT